MQTPLCGTLYVWVLFKNSNAIKLLWYHTEAIKSGWRSASSRFEYVSNGNLQEIESLQRNETTPYDNTLHARKLTVILTVFQIKNQYSVQLKIIIASFFVATFQYYEQRTTDSLNTAYLFKTKLQTFAFSFLKALKVFIDRAARLVTWYNFSEVLISFFMRCSTFLLNCDHNMSHLILKKSLTWKYNETYTGELR